MLHCYGHAALRWFGSGTSGSGHGENDFFVAVLLQFYWHFFLHSVQISASKPPLRIARDSWILPSDHNTISQATIHCFIVGVHISTWSGSAAGLEVIFRLQALICFSHKAVLLDKNHSSQQVRQWSRQYWQEGGNARHVKRAWKSMCDENRIATQYQNCWPGIVNTSARKPNLEKLCTHFVTQVSKQPPCEQNQLLKDVDVQHFNCVKKIHKITRSPGRCPNVFESVPSKMSWTNFGNSICVEEYVSMSRLRDCHNMPGPHDVCKRNQCLVSLRHYLVAYLLRRRLSARWGWSKEMEMWNRSLWLSCKTWSKGDGTVRREWYLMQRISSPGTKTWTTICWTCSTICCGQVTLNKVGKALFGFVWGSTNQAIGNPLLSGKRLRYAHKYCTKIDIHGEPTLQSKNNLGLWPTWTVADATLIFENMWSKSLEWFVPLQSANLNFKRVFIQIKYASSFEASKIQIIPHLKRRIKLFF